MKKNWVYFSIFAGACIILYPILRSYIIPNRSVLPAEWDPAAFLLTVSALAAAISGIGFAIYGYYNVNSAEKIVEKKLEERFKDFQSKMNKENLKIQEALQKIIAGYNIQSQNIDMAIELYKQAIELYPNIYNGYTSLAYAYWQKKDLISAKKYFDLALQCNPHSFQCLNDLARFSSENEEYISALNYLKQVLELNPFAYKDIENDPIFGKLKQLYPDEFNSIIDKAKNNNKTDNAN